jgi:hypothetical protein
LLLLWAVLYVLECMHFYNILFANIDLKESLNVSTIICGIEVSMLYFVKLFFKRVNLCKSIINSFFSLFFYHDFFWVDVSPSYFNNIVKMEKLCVIK